MSQVNNAAIEIIPKRFVQALILLVVFSLFSVFIFRFLDVPKLGVPPKSFISEEILVRFSDENRTGVLVRDAGGQIIGDSMDGKSGFLEVVYNAIKRERIKKRILTDKSLRLVLYDNGRITLIDDSTDLEIHLNSFGLNNLEVFGELFKR